MWGLGRLINGGGRRMEEGDWERKGIEIEGEELEMVIGWSVEIGLGWKLRMLKIGIRRNMKIIVEEWKIENEVVEMVEERKSDEMEIVENREKIEMEIGNSRVVEVIFKVERRREVIGEKIERMRIVKGLREEKGMWEIRIGSLNKDKIEIRRIGNRKGDEWIDEIIKMIEELRSEEWLVIEERMVEIVDIRSKKIGWLRISERKDEGRSENEVGWKEWRVEVEDVRWGRDKKIEEKMEEIILRRKMVLKVKERRKGIDIGFNDIEGIKREEKEWIGIRKDGREKCVKRKKIELGGLDMVGELKSEVDEIWKIWKGIGRIERMVGINGWWSVGVWWKMKEGKVDRIKKGEKNMNGMVEGKREKRIEEILIVDKIKEEVWKNLGKRIIYIKRKEKNFKVLGSMRKLNEVEEEIGWRRDEDVKICNLGV